MEDRVAVKVRVARAGQTEFVRKDTGLMIEKAAFFEDVLSRRLSFGTRPMSEPDQVTVSQSGLLAFRFTSFCAQVEILASLSAGGVDVTLSSNFDSSTEMVIEANGTVSSALETWRKDAIEFRLPRKENICSPETSDSNQLQVRAQVVNPVVLH